jgi:hypothetical protein
VVNSAVPVRYLGWDETAGETAEGQPAGEPEKKVETDSPEASTSDNTPSEKESEKISEKGLQGGEDGDSVQFSSDDRLNGELNKLLREASTYAEFRKKAALVATTANDDNALTLILNEKKVWKK